jgi:hypothetical protein
MIEIFLTIITLGLKPLYDKNNSYYKIIAQFRNKLPRHQNQAKKLTEEEIAKSVLFKGVAQFMTVLNVSPHKTSLTEAEIDEFYNQLNNFDYRFIFFKDYYRRHTNNLNRFNPKAENKNFDLAIIQIVLKEDPLHPLKPIPVFIYHLKYKYKITSSIYLWERKRKRQKKLKNSHNSK